MTTKRRVDIYSAGCELCAETIALIERMACASCEVKVLDMNDSAVIQEAKALGVSTVPAVAIDGQLVSCCQGQGPDENALRQAGLGQSLP